MAGYCLTATAKLQGMRIITVVMGEPDSNTRNKETTEMLNYAFATYKVQKLLQQEEILGKAKVVKGKNKYVELIPATEATIVSKKIDKEKKVSYKLHINNIKAPIKKGDVVGKMTLLADNVKVRDVNITINEDVLKTNYLELYFNSIKDIISGKIGF